MIEVGSKPDQDLEQPAVEVSADQAVAISAADLRRFLELPDDVDQ